MTGFINVADATWLLGFTHKGKNYVLGLRDLHQGNLFFIETGVKSMTLLNSGEPACELVEAKVKS